MKKHWWALFVALVMYAPLLAAQGTPPPKGGGSSGSTASELGQNYPNPVVTDTKIPFTVSGGAGCQEPSQLHKVSLKIYNILSQFVAVPVLQNGGAPVENVMLTCDQYTAYWDAKYSKTGQSVPPGIYLYRLEVDGRVITKKLIVSK